MRVGYGSEFQLLFRMIPLKGVGKNILDLKDLPVPSQRLSNR